jgi:hypothetical protein
MCQQAQAGRPLTVGCDARITRAGRFLRRSKLDELPQLVNVVLGSMSLVGPRPEVPRYVDRYPPEVRATVLSVAPGITDWAAILYKDENDILGRAADPERAYVETILPVKLAYYQRYVRERSFWLDLRIILRTLAAWPGADEAAMDWSSCIHLGDLALTIPAAGAIAAWLCAARAWRAAAGWLLVFGLALALVAGTKIAFMGWAPAAGTGLQGHERPCRRLRGRPFRPCAGCCSGAAPVGVAARTGRGGGLDRERRGRRRAGARRRAHAGRSRRRLAGRRWRHSPARCAWRAAPRHRPAQRRRRTAGVRPRRWAPGSWRRRLNRWMIRVALALSGNPSPYPWDTAGSAFHHVPTGKSHAQHAASFLPLAARSQPDSNSIHSLLIALLRGLAALQVAAAHLRAEIFPGLREMADPPLAYQLLAFATGFAHQAVVVFFLISGWLVGGSLLNKLGQPRRPAQLCDRPRDAPVDGAAAGPVLMLASAPGPAPSTAPAPISRPRTIIRSPASPAICWACRPCCSPFGGNYALWSLANETWYYVQFPLLLLVFTGPQPPAPARRRHCSGAGRPPCPSRSPCISLLWLLGAAFSRLRIECGNGWRRPAARTRHRLLGVFPHERQQRRPQARILPAGPRVQPAPAGFAVPRCKRPCDQNLAGCGAIPLRPSCCPSSRSRCT